MVHSLFLTALGFSTVCALTYILLFIFHAYIYLYISPAERAESYPKGFWRTIWAQFLWRKP